MFTKNKGVAPRAWSILRLLLLWARKGGLFRRRHMIDPLRCTERELSFEKTPIVHVKMHRPHSVLFAMPRLPCINPRTDYDFDCEVYSNKHGEGNAGYYDAERISCTENNFEGGSTPRVSYELEAVEGIDFKAEEFIAKFYQQMKLQRQMSYLEYVETQNRSSP